MTRRQRLLGTTVAIALLVMAGACSKESSGTSAAGGANASPGSSTAAPPGSASGSAGGSSTTAANSATAGAKYAGFDDPVYAKGENWLCGPGAATDDRCKRADLDVTVVRADGTTEVRKSGSADDAKFDCFYVYPTVNFTGGPGNDETMAADTAVEDSVTRAQAARFREVCRVYAPLYRQMTISGFASQDRDKLQAIAYGDVRNAFKHYMAKWNQGRPVLLIGHSQGSGLLDQLLKDEFDGDATARSQLVSAMLIGGFSSVAAGKDTGGSFANIPACRKPDQTGCVIGFNSTAADTSADELKRWGSAEGGKQRLCTNPAALGGGSGTLDPILADQAKQYSTPWVEYPGALTAECKTDAGVTTMTIVGTPGDKRDLSAQVKNVAGWGLHINEMNLTHGDLIAIARQQGAAMTSK